MERNYRLPLGSKAGGLSYTVLILVNLLVSILGSAVISLGSLTGSDAAKYISVLVSPVAIAVILTLALKLVKQPARSLMPVKAHPKYFAIAALLAFGLLFSLNSVNGYVVKLFELMGYQPRESFLPDYHGWKVLPVMIVVAVIPAFMEEIMFRGILLNNAEEGVGTVRAIFITGFCFALYHGSVEQTAYQFICGCVYAFLALRSRSVAPTVLAHFLNNAVVIILYACGVVNEATGEIIMPQAGEIVLYVLSAVSLIGAVVWLILDKKEVKNPAENGVKEFFIYSAIGIGAMALIWIAGLFLK